jgi:hypothetical protein
MQLRQNIRTHPFAFATKARSILMAFATDHDGAPSAPLSINKGHLAKGVPRYPGIEEPQDLDFRSICRVIADAFLCRHGHKTGARCITLAITLIRRPIGRGRIGGTSIAKRKAHIAVDLASAAAHAGGKSLGNASHLEQLGVTRLDLLALRQHRGGIGFEQFQRR